MRELTRRSVMALGLGSSALAASGRIALAARPQRTVVVMFDGFGMEYLEGSAMPVLKKWASEGIFAPVKAVMPSVTNCNNASICCGTWPSEHGVIGNSYLNQKTGQEDYMEDGTLLLAPTIFERAKTHGVSSALLTRKRKRRHYSAGERRSSLLQRHLLLNGRHGLEKRPGFTVEKSITGSSKLP